MLETGFEIVHTVTDYYDGPRRGIADYEGVPHLYESEWDDLEDTYATTFRLSRAEPEVFAMAMENWAIWRRWETAFHTGRTTLESHPALPEERARYTEFDRQLRGRMKIDPSSFRRAHGEFRPRDDADWSGHGRRALQVRWTSPDGEAG